MDEPDIELVRDAVGWPRVETWALRRIARLQRDMETAPADLPGAVATIQGRIKELRHLLKQGEPEEPQTAGQVY